MKEFWNVFVLKTVWDSFFMNDAHFIVSRRGLELLHKMRQKGALIELMEHDEEAGLYESDFKAYVAQHRNEEELRREGAIDFAKWLALNDWMSIWVVDKWMWENVNILPTNDESIWKGYYTEEQLYELYLKENEN